MCLRGCSEFMCIQIAVVVAHAITMLWWCYTLEVCWAVCSDHISEFLRCSTGKYICRTVCSYLCHTDCDFACLYFIFLLLVRKFFLSISKLEFTFMHLVLFIIFISQSISLKFSYSCCKMHVQMYADIEVKSPMLDCLGRWTLLKDDPLLFTMALLFIKPHEQLDMLGLLLVKIILSCSVSFINHSQA